MTYIREKAVALQYEDVEALPRILASGAGEIARQIVSIAQRHGVPVHQDSSLTDLLSQLQVGSVISPESFRLLAEIVCFLYYTDCEWRREHASLAPIIEIPFTVAEETVSEPVLKEGIDKG